MACGFSATERTLLAFAIEGGTYGTAVNGYTTDGASIPASDQITVYDSFSPIQANIEAIQLNPATGDLGPGDFLPGRSLFTIQFDVCLFGSGTPATPPHYLEILRFCGYRRFNISGAAPTTPTVALNAGLGVLGAGKIKWAVATVTDGTYALGDAASAHVWTISQLAVSAEKAVTAADNAVVTFDAAGTGKRTFIFRTYVDTTAAVAPYFLVGEAGPAATTFTDDHTQDPQVGVEFPNNVGTPLTAGVWYLPPSGASCPESASLAVWLDGEILIATGVRGTVSQIQLPAGGISKCTVQAQGLYTDPVAVANPAFTARSTPPQFQAAGCKVWYENPSALGTIKATAGTVDPFIPKVKSVTISLGTQITERRDANATNAVTELGIVRKFQPRFGINYEGDTTYPAIKSMKNGLYAYSGCIVGPNTSGRRIKINAARMRYQSNPTYGDSEGYRTFDSVWVPGGGGGSDYLSFLHY